MPLWVLLAAVAAVWQLLRNALARSLVGRVSTALTSWARFAFNLPFSAATVVVLSVTAGWPVLSPSFFGWCAATAVAQMSANLALVAAFRRASFSRSVTLHKLEVVAGALLGVALFGEFPSLLGWLGIGLSCAGVLLLQGSGEARGGGEGESGGFRRAFALEAGPLLALSCALLLACAGFLLKEATAEFASQNPRVGTGRFEAAAHTLFHTTWIEVAALSAAIAVRGRGAFRPVRHHWRRMLAIGWVGFCGSLCWFWAYAIALVAYVRAVGQIEAVLAVFVAFYVFREVRVLSQLPGIAVVSAGILLVLLG